MGRNVKTKASTLKQEVDEHVHPPPSNVAQQEAKALETLAALLDSKDERIRLEAAQAILNCPLAASSTSEALDVVKKISKAI